MRKPEQITELEVVVDDRKRKVQVAGFKMPIPGACKFHGDTYFVFVQDQSLLLCHKCIGVLREVSETLKKQGFN